MVAQSETYESEDNVAFRLIDAALGVPPVIHPV